MPPPEGPKNPRGRGPICGAGLWRRPPIGCRIKGAAGGQAWPIRGWLGTEQGIEELGRQRRAIASPVRRAARRIVGVQQRYRRLYRHDRSRPFILARNCGDMKTISDLPSFAAREVRLAVKRLVRMGKPRWSLFRLTDGELCPTGFGWAKLDAEAEIEAMYREIGGEG
jgi:hypothetical protein